MESTIQGYDYKWLKAEAILEPRVLNEYARLLAEVFSEPPWSFHWSRYLNQPNDERSPHAFLRMIVRHGGEFLEARKSDASRLVGYAMLIPSLSEDALAGDYVDLRTHGDAQVGDAYMAGVLVDESCRLDGIGRCLTAKRLEHVGSRKRCLLRTQMSAKGVVKIAGRTGFERYATYSYEQAGSELERVIFVREPIE